MRKITYTLLATLFAVTLLTAQSPRKLQYWMQRATEAFQQENYSGSIAYYEVALEFPGLNDNQRDSIYLRQGEAALLMYAFLDAESYLKKVKNTTRFPQVHYYLGRTLQRRSEYSSAVNSYRNFLNTSADSTAAVRQLRQRAVVDISNCEWAARRDTFPIPDKYKPRVLRYNASAEQVARADTAINGLNADVGAIFIPNGEIEYSQFGYLGTSYKQKFRKGYFKLRKSVGLDAANESSSLYQTPHNQPDEDKHIAYSTYNRDRTQTFFCECEYLDKKSADIRCAIKMSTRPSRENQWGKAVTVFASDQFTYLQPTVAESRTEGELLVFVSDSTASAAQGDLNIYYLPTGAIRADGSTSPSALRTLKTANTSANEVTPFYHANTRRLYFSSDQIYDNLDTASIEPGMRSAGGFDVYYLEGDFGAWSSSRKPMDARINKGFDEFGYTLDADGKTALYSSNRWGDSLRVVFCPEGTDCENQQLDICCFDIYKQKMGDVFIEVAMDPLCAGANTFGDISITPIDGQLLDLGVEVSSREPNLRSAQQIQVDNPFSFQEPFEWQKAYRVQAAIDGYEASIDTLFDVANLVPQPRDTTLRIKLDLTPQYTQLDLKVQDQCTGAPLADASVQVYAEANPGRSPKVNRTTDKFTLQQLRIGQTYTLQVALNGYDSIQTDIRITEEQLRENCLPRMTLRMEQDTSFGPYHLFLQNNRPLWEGHPSRNVTREEYVTSNKAYDELKQEYDALLNDESTLQQFTKARQVIDPTTDETVAQLFLRSLRQNTIDADYKFMTENLIDTLQPWLDRGYEFTVELASFTSPVGSAQYNKALSRRRMNSITQLLQQEPRLGQYFRPDRVLDTLTLGETNAVQNLTNSVDGAEKLLDVKSTDDLEDGTKSYLSRYSATAMLTRRVDVARVLLVCPTPRPAEILSDRNDDSGPEPTPTEDETP